MTDMIDRELMIIEIHIKWKSKGKYIQHIIQSSLFDEDPIREELSLFHKHFLKLTLQTVRQGCWDNLILSTLSKNVLQ